MSSERACEAALTFMELATWPADIAWASRE